MNFEVARTPDPNAVPLRLTDRGRAGKPGARFQNFTVTEAFTLKPVPGMMSAWLRAA